MERGLPRFCARRRIFAGGAAFFADGAISEDAAFGLRDMDADGVPERIAFNNGEPATSIRSAPERSHIWATSVSAGMGFSTRMTHPIGAQ